MVRAAAIRDHVCRYLRLQVHPLSWQRVVETAWSITWTRDPFDRLIVAHAMAADARLITCDATLREHSKIALW
ncbi:MAG: PIN domain-containing protein [Polyangiales bacterium]